MLNFFTTWNTTMILIPYLRKHNSRGLIALSTCVSVGGTSFIIGNLYTKKNRWHWKDIEINKLYYFFLELLIHQYPLYYLLKDRTLSGDALNAIIPVAMYCSLVTNPYKVCGHKLKNYYGIIMIGIAAPIVNHLTR